MLKKKATLFAVCLALAACASAPQPRVIQAATNSPNIVVTVGMATQIEMPEDGRVTSVAVGNPAILSAEQATDVINLSAKGDPGETNLIIRARTSDDEVKVYQYHVTVQKN